MDPGQVSSFTNTPFFKEVVSKPPTALLVILGITLVFALFSPVFTLICMSIKDWFKVETEPAVRWYNFIYATLITVSIGFLLREFHNLKKLAEKPGSGIE